MRELGRYGVAAYLKREVKKAGGMVEAFKSPGRANVPDWLVTWPDSEYSAVIDFVETKAPGKKPRPGQVRDHKRRRRLGANVFVLSSKEQVDSYIEGRTTWVLSSATRCSASASPSATSRRRC